MGFKRKLAYISLSCVILLSGIATFTNAQAPEETRIAFESARRLGGLSEIYIMDTNGNNEHPLMKEAPGNEQFPAWSPDGKTIAFTSNRDGGGGSALVDIYLVDLEKDKELGLKDGNPRNITNNPALDHYPAWSPDGKSIAFQSNRDGNLEIYVMDTDGNNQRRLTRKAESDKNPAWFDPRGLSVSPTGKLKTSWARLKQKIE
jgi:TolB protein